MSDGEAESSYNLHYTASTLGQWKSPNLAQESDKGTSISQEIIQLFSLLGSGEDSSDGLSKPAPMLAGGSLTPFLPQPIALPGTDPSPWVGDRGLRFPAIRSARWRHGGVTRRGTGARAAAETGSGKGPFFSDFSYTTQVVGRPVEDPNPRIKCHLGFMHAVSNT